MEHVGKSTNLWIKLFLQSLPKDEDDKCEGYEQMRLKIGETEDNPLILQKPLYYTSKKIREYFLGKRELYIKFEDEEAKCGDFIEVLEESGYEYEIVSKIPLNLFSVDRTEMVVKLRQNTEELK